MAISTETKRFLINTILALLGLTIPFAQWIFSEKEKSISYKIISTQQLLPNNKSGLSVFSQEKKIENATFYRLVIKNNGTIPILRSEFDEQISIKVGEKSEVLYAEIASTIPPSLSAKINKKENFITIDPLLLNPDDAIEISLGVSGENGQPTITGHITGIKNITIDNSLDPAQKKKEFFARLALFIGAPAFGFMFACLIEFTRPLPQLKRISILLICIMGGELPLVLTSGQLTWFQDSFDTKEIALLISLILLGFILKTILIGKRKTLLAAQSRTIANPFDK